MRPLVEGKKTAACFIAHTLFLTGKARAVPRLLGGNDANDRFIASPGQKTTSHLNCEHLARLCSTDGRFTATAFRDGKKKKNNCRADMRKF